MEEIFFRHGCNRPWFYEECNSEWSWIQKYRLARLSTLSVYWFEKGMKWKLKARPFEDRWIYITAYRNGGHVLNDWSCLSEPFTHYTLSKTEAKPEFSKPLDRGRRSWREWFRFSLLRLWKCLAWCLQVNSCCPQSEIIFSVGLLHVLGLYPDNRVTWAVFTFVFVVRIKTQCRKSPPSSFW